MFSHWAGESVVGADSPSVGIIYKDFVGSHVNHGFDGKGHSRYDHHARTPVGRNALRPVPHGIASLRHVRRDHELR